MKKKSNLLLLIKRIALLLLFMSVCRLLFLIFNFSYFHEYAFFSLVTAFFYGLRFDITVTVILCLPFIILHLLPFQFFYSKIYQAVVKVLFFVPAFFMLLMNCIDMGLFRFAGKRITADIFGIMNYGEDISNTIPAMVLDFWHLLLILLGLFFLLFLLYNKIAIFDQGAIGQSSAKRNSFYTFSLHIIVVALVFIGFRGGIQYKPIHILTATKYGTGPIASLVLNSPFTFVKTFGKSTLNKVEYYDQETLQSIYPVVKSESDSSKFQALNVVLIIMESVGSEYIGSLNNEKGYTPFLDSLMEHSLVLKNSFANGKRSIEGIPAILAGIPALLSEPFITSSYSGNSFESLASLLAKQGYSSAFYHGGTNGTMGFDNFSRSCGYEKYFGRYEYNNDKDFDGNWGIYDEPFLLKFAENMNTMKTPFITTVFTLTSHHPYNIPADFEGKFDGGTLPIHKSVQYTDHSLHSFFNYASGQKWYQNTLFVITSDHTALAEKAFYHNRVGMYSIPLIFFRPDGSLKAVSEKVSQQIDIMPSVLDYLNYERPYFSFGSSVFDTGAEGFAVNYINDTYQLIDDKYSLILDTVQGNFLFDYKSDLTLQKNIIATQRKHATLMERKIKAIIQTYNNSLIENQMIR
ncbi:MAG TPA: sulfatase-like hydrolase/transferase [Bacteroidia bacterium]|nr:sulfatase-like hydrolase/transferase [Bacteroidia bacterium]